MWNLHLVKNFRGGGGAMPVELGPARRLRTRSQRRRRRPRRARARATRLRRGEPRCVAGRAAAPAECAPRGGRQRWRVSGSAFALAAVSLIFILGFRSRRSRPTASSTSSYACRPASSSAASPSYRRTRLRSASFGVRHADHDDRGARPSARCRTQILQLTGDAPAVDCAPTTMFGDHDRRRGRRRALLVCACPRLDVAAEWLLPVLSHGLPHARARRVAADVELSARLGAPRPEHARGAGGGGGRRRRVHGDRQLLERALLRRRARSVLRASDALAPRPRAASARAHVRQGRGAAGGLSRCAHQRPRRHARAQPREAELSRAASGGAQ